MHSGRGRRNDVYPGDTFATLLGATMWVAGILTLGSASAILFALLRTATGAGGLASTRLIPPVGVGYHAEEVRARIRMRYMARAAALYPALSFEEPAGARVPSEVRITVLVAERAAMPITKLPPLNESLQRGLAVRTPAPAPTTVSTQSSRRRRKQRRRTSRPRSPKVVA
jgi:hypothetical protein